MHVCWYPADTVKLSRACATEEQQTTAAAAATAAAASREVGFELEWVLLLPAVRTACCRAPRLREQISPEGQGPMSLQGTCIQHFHSVVHVSPVRGSRHHHTPHHQRSEMNYLRVLLSRTTASNKGVIRAPIGLSRGYLLQARKGGGRRPRSAVYPLPPLSPRPTGREKQSRSVVRTKVGSAASQPLS